MLRFLILDKLSQFGFMECHDGLILLSHGSKVIFEPNELCPKSARLTETACGLALQSALITSSQGSIQSGFVWIEVFSIVPHRGVGSNEPMSRIDYSKWDKIEYDSSSSEDEGMGPPRVTQLNAPSRITRTPDGTLFIDDEATTPTRSHVEPPKNSQPPTDIPSSWTEKGSAVAVGECQLYWSQDRYSVTLRAALPDTDTNKDWTCHVSNLLPFESRNAAVGSLEHSHLIVQRTGAVEKLLEGDLPHPVHAAEGEDGVDWSIERHGNTRYMVVLLYKASIMQGMTLWWKQPFTECPEIELEWRKDNASNAFSEAWQHAQDEFRLKLAGGDLKHAL